MLPKFYRVSFFKHDPEPFIVWVLHTQYANIVPTPGDSRALSSSQYCLVERCNSQHQAPSEFISYLTTCDAYRGLTELFQSRLVKKGLGKPSSIPVLQWDPSHRHLFFPLASPHWAKSKEMTGRLKVSLSEVLTCNCMFKWCLNVQTFKKNVKNGIKAHQS